MTETVATVEPIEFTCTENDLLDAQRLHHTLTLRGRRFLIRTAAIAVALAGVSMIVRQKADAETLAYGLAFAAIYACVIVIAIVVTRLVTLPRAARRQFSQQKEFRGPMKVGINPAHIAVTSKNGFSNTPTEDFLKWAENGKSILLYRSDRLFNLVPKRVVSDAFHRSLMAELTRAGVPKAGFSKS